MAGLTITAGLRILDGSAAPFQIVATRVQSGHPQVRIQLLDARQRDNTQDRWLESGQNTGTGWYLATISTTDALFLSPHGNPVRLRFSEDQMILAEDLQQVDDVSRRLTAAPPTP